MKVYRKYVDSDYIEETTIEVAIDKLENHGWYKIGTVSELIQRGQIVSNPYCQYAKNKRMLKTDY